MVAAPAGDGELSQGTAGTGQRPVTAAGGGYVNGFPPGLA
jgi:hypothetical protein